jgi:IS4 transposase
LTSLIATRRLNELAWDTGLVRRRRKVVPMALFWTIVLGFGAGRERTLAGLRRVYQKSTGTMLVPSAFYDRFTASLVRFFRAVVRELLDKAHAGSRLQGVLASFRDVVLTDATVVKLHDLLEKAFPACRTNHTRAAAKLHVVMSVTGKGPRTVKVTSGRRHDGPVFRVGQWVRDRLLVFDLGYFRYQLFDCIDRNGGYFISRLKENANPHIVNALRQWRGRSVPLVGRRLREVAGRLKREVLDVEVEVSFRRRVYAGRRSGKRRRLRLVGVRDSNTGRYHFYLTNISPERLSAEEVARTYACRWQIELLFKEMKSAYRLGELPSSKRVIVETLLLATVVTVVVSRQLLHAIRRKLAHPYRVPDARWAALFATVATTILDLLLAPPQLSRSLAKWLEAMLMHEAVDPNISRPLLLDRVQYGVTS